MLRACSVESLLSLGAGGGECSRVGGVGAGVLMFASAPLDQFQRTMVTPTLSATHLVGQRTALSLSLLR